MISSAMTMRIRAVLLGSAVGVVGFGAWPGAAHAGTFDVRSCLVDRAGYSSRAFVLANRQLDLTRGMLVRRTCDVHLPGTLGIVTGEAGGGSRRRGARAVLRVFAPPGTSIKSIDWSGAVSRPRDCGWAMEVYAADQYRPLRPIYTKKAATRKSDPCRKIVPKIRLAALPRFKHVDLPPGATRIVQRMICQGHGRASCSARGRNFITTFGARVTLQDEQAPHVAITGGSLVSGAWVNGRQTLDFDASDNVGVANTAVLGEGSQKIAVGTPRACDFSNPTPCPNGGGQVTLDTTNAPREGTQRVVVEANDAAQKTGLSDPAVARIDNTPPARVDTTVDGGQSWRNTNDYTVRWQNPLEPDRAPIVAANYRVCRPGPKECSDVQRRTGADLSELSKLTVPAPGEWVLTMWREDTATNHEEDNASVPVALRYDPEVPQLAFEDPSAPDPTRVVVQVNEQVSGIADGQVEISREGSGVWQPLDTQRAPGQLLARIDDARLAAGTYSLRARATDLAGNVGGTARRLNGSPMTVTLPLRVVATIHTGITKKRTLLRLIRRHRKRRRVKRRVVKLVPKTRVRYGREIHIAGRLSNPSGDPLADQTIFVGSRSAASAERLLAVLRTDTHGRFSYVARASESRTLRFVYLGTGLTLPAASEVQMLVPAATGIHVNRRRVVNGQWVAFRGRLKTLPVPTGGKLVELQVRLGRRWQTFRTTRTNANGHWRVRYRFRRTVGIQRYRFRARLPAEGGYPFETGRSRAARVRVRGRS